MKFQRSELTNAIIRFLASFNKGDEVRYSEIAAIVGGEISATTGALRTARMILQRDHGAVWGCVMPNVGLRRLPDAEIAGRLPSWWLKGARRKIASGIDQADIVDLSALDINQMARFSVDVIQAHLAHDSLSKATNRRLERVARGTSNDLPSFTAVEWAISLSRRGS